MHIHRLQVTVPKDHDREIAVPLPDDFPSGPAEVIVFADSQKASRSLAPATDDFESFQRVYPFSLSSLGGGAPGPRSS